MRSWWFGPTEPTLAQYTLLRFAQFQENIWTGKVQFGILCVWLERRTGHMDLISLFIRAYIIFQLCKALRLKTRVQSMSKDPVLIDVFNISWLPQDQPFHLRFTQPEHFHCYSDVAYWVLAWIFNLPDTFSQNMCLYRFDRSLFYTAMKPLCMAPFPFVSLITCWSTLLSSQYLPSLWQCSNVFHHEVHNFPQNKFPLYPCEAAPSWAPVLLCKTTGWYFRSAPILSLFCSYPLLVLSHPIHSLCGW